MTMVMAAIMVIYRARPNTPSSGPSVLQSLFLMPLALVFGDPLKTSEVEIAILAAFGVMHAIASVTLAEGTGNTTCSYPRISGSDRDTSDAHLNWGNGCFYCCADLAMETTRIVEPFRPILF